MYKLILITLSLLLFSSHALAEWKLNNSESSLHFISIKKSSVAEIHHFKSITGEVDAKGSVEIAIDLASVESNIPVRNERMQSMLFNVEKFTQANINGKVDLQKLASLAAGETHQETITLTLELHGISQALQSEAEVIKLVDNRLLVRSTTPIIINAQDYNLTKGIEMLRTVAKLPSISHAVPVSYSLVFEK